MRRVSPPVPDVSPTASPRRGWLTLLRVVGTVALGTWLVVAIDWAEVWQVLRDAAPGPILLMLVLLAIGPCLSAYKWQLLLAVHGRHFPLGQLTRWYIAAIFLSQFLPTTIGGDAYRVYKTLGARGTRSRAVLAVLVERVSGIVALAAMGYGAAVVVHYRTGHDLAGWVVVAGSVGGAAGVLGAWALFRLPAAKFLRGIPGVPRVMTTVENVVNEFRAHPREVSRALVLSFLFHLDRIAVIWLALEALDARAGFLVLTVAATVVEVVSLLPISLGGLVVAEGSFMYVMTQFGGAATSALAAMLLIRVLLVPLHLVGAYFYFTGGGTPASGPVSSGADRILPPAASTVDTTAVASVHRNSPTP